MSNKFKSIAVVGARLVGPEADRGGVRGRGVHGCDPQEAAARRIGHG